MGEFHINLILEANNNYNLDQIECEEVFKKIQKDQANYEKK